MKLRFKSVAGSYEFYRGDELLAYFLSNGLKGYTLRILRELSEDENAQLNQFIYELYSRGIPVCGMISRERLNSVISEWRKKVETTGSQKS